MHGPHAESDAAEIVRRYNAHAALVEALREIVECERYEPLSDPRGVLSYVEDVARAALAEAGEVRE